jgi:hypothetical protein
VEDKEVGQAMKRAILPVALLSVALMVLLPYASALAVVNNSSKPLTATVTGPSLMNILGKANFVVTASGGPSQLPNGTMSGNYTYNATISGGNTSGSSVTPHTGELVNGTATLALVAPNNTGTYALTVEVISNPTTGSPAFYNTSVDFTVAIPYVLSATITNPNSFTVSGAIIQVSLDGTIVGTVTLPSIAGNGTYALTYNYTTAGLSSGWHTFSLAIQGIPSILVFTNGQGTLTVSFYVNPPPVNYEMYYLLGITLALLAIFISLLVVGGRRRRSSK